MFIMFIVISMYRINLRCRVVNKYTYMEIPCLVLCGDKMATISRLAFTYGYICSSISLCIKHLLSIHVSLPKDYDIHCEFKIYHRVVFDV